MNLKRKDLLGIQELSVDEINLILETADSFKEVSGRDIKKVPTLRGKTVVNLFFEPSTRTRTSFELAAKRLSADVINFTTSTSSMVKGETLLDTASNIQAMRADFIVLRHPAAGAPTILARALQATGVTSILPKPCSIYLRYVRRNGSFMVCGSRLSATLPIVAWPAPPSTPSPSSGQRFTSPARLP